MKTRHHLSIISLAALLLAGGCATADTTSYPTLATREAERTGFSDYGDDQTTDAGQDADQLIPLREDYAARLPALLTQAEQAHQRFLAAVPAAQSRARSAAGAASGSEAWAVSTVALADLDSLRNPATIALADLDTIHIATEMEGYQADSVTKTREAVLAMVAHQDETLTRLRGQTDN